jgi:hypothetical protein
MRVLCIENRGDADSFTNGENYKYNVTIGKWYDVINSNFNYYILVDDGGHYGGHTVALPKRLFISESDIRDNKLILLGL